MLYYPRIMKSSREIRIEQLQDKKWHAENCDIEYDTEYIHGGTTAHCVQHLVDITELLPDYEDMNQDDPYNNFQENDLLHK